MLNDFLSNRRGVSPLIATMILIGVSVILGAVVMSWGESYIEDRAEFVTGNSACTNVYFSIIKSGGQDLACYTDSSLEVSLDNGPRSSIYDFGVRVVGSSGILNVESTLSTPLLEGSGFKLVVPFANIGDVSQVKITPKVSSGNEFLLCDEKSIIVEPVRKC